MSVWIVGVFVVQNWWNVFFLQMQAEFFLWLLAQTTCLTWDDIWVSLLVMVLWGFFPKKKKDLFFCHCLCWLCFIVKEKKGKGFYNEITCNILLLKKVIWNRDYRLFSEQVFSRFLKDKIYLPLSFWCCECTGLLRPANVPHSGPVLLVCTLGSSPVSHRGSTWAKI